MSDATHSVTPPNIPIIDIRTLRSKGEDRTEVAAALRKACTESGFFYIKGHGIDEGLQLRLEEESRAFFDLPLVEKKKIDMAVGGRAWRGYFPVGEELTSGRPDLKEGLYLGVELAEDDPRVQMGLPLHGRNLFPENRPAFQEVILEYIQAVTRLGHQLMEGLSLSLGLEASFLDQHYTNDPLCLFRIFHYPFSDREQTDEVAWGVGEHTDYGLLTILKQDDAGGLQIKSDGKWIAAPVVPGTFVCNIGDMLDRMTGGYYRSTPHRVLNQAGRSRYSFPFFFDPNWNAKVKPIPLDGVADGRNQQATGRWDRANVHEFEGTYGEYILGKVGKVFPDLQKKV
ncbi:MAG: 2-oxoglutarate and iron-dependent oxygenase domain-containing protein [Bacteroidota bacterium]